MIGLVAKRGDLDVAKEFFELFKTPWEPAVSGRKYRVILATCEEIEKVDAEVLILYGAGERHFDREAGVEATQLPGPVSISWKQWTFPIYRGVGVFESDGEEGNLKVQGRMVEYRGRTEGRVVRRIGYDLFEEIRYLLTVGQPAAQALTPTLDLHIDLLRHLLIESQIPFLEIPPFPEGHKFICCLTHDVDFFGIRRHKFDRTMAGFLYRASIGTLIDLVRGRRLLQEAARNWLALLSLPLVFLRVLPDFWRPFDGYAKVEAGLPSTFFLVPFKDKPGHALEGTLNTWRAVPYGIAEIQDEVKEAAARGVELGVHGIDAWRDAAAGREELGQLKAITEQKAVGIRMHWLYFDGDSPAWLEKAGFDYDSTWGYNETVGYRAGTSQIFRPLKTETLMEIPMSIMDSALFSTGRMNLERREALQLCAGIVNNARKFGGTLVINWHERSLAPERLWGRVYAELLDMVRKGERVWFATAGEAVEWFRWRRSVIFRGTLSSNGVSTIHVSAPCSASPGAIVRIHRLGKPMAEMQELAFDGLTPVELQVCIEGDIRNQPVVEL